MGLFVLRAWVWMVIAAFVFLMFPILCGLPSD